MAARLSSWCPSAVQLRAMPLSTVERRAEFLGSAPRILYSAAYALHCSTEGIWLLRRTQWPGRLEGKFYSFRSSYLLFPSDFALGGSPACTNHRQRNRRAANRRPHRLLALPESHRGSLFGHDDQGQAPAKRIPYSSVPRKSRPFEGAFGLMKSSIATANRSSARRPWMKCVSALLRLNLSSF